MNSSTPDWEGHNTATKFASTSGWFCGELNVSTNIFFTFHPSFCFPPQNQKFVLKLCQMVCVLCVVRKNKMTPDDCTLTEHFPHSLVFKWKTSQPQRHKSAPLSSRFHHRNVKPVFQSQYENMGKRKKHEVMYLVPIKHKWKSRRSSYNWLGCVYTCLPPVPAQSFSSTWALKCGFKARGLPWITENPQDVLWPLRRWKPNMSLRRWSTLAYRLFLVGVHSR